ncbi:tyrosine-type recombinase/integrase [Pseudoxanthomonas sp.]|jgi:Phage integrase family.|uniref:tyrosine-type recombinase/integrase n=1 Tax=Pseudoxanthomonas sp. TaxID=1871049 RepID=UPI002FE3E365
MESKVFRKVSLTSTIVKERLSFDRVPRANSRGQIIDFDPNEGQKRFVVFDSHGDAPVGFGVAVNRTNMSYILQRRVGQRVLKATIGNVRDMPLAKARLEAQKVLEGMRASKQSPAETRQALEGDLRVAEMTLAECIAMYRTHLVERKTKPAKDSTLRGLEQAERRLGRKGVELIARQVGSLITESAILDSFDALASGRRALREGTTRAKMDRQAFEQPTVTTAELTFRWASRAVAYSMEREERVAANQRRETSLRRNPFLVLRDEGRYRTKQQLEQHYEDQGARNPMQLRDGSLGRFLDALWQRRKTDNYRTACDYLLLTLLWGTRRGEAAPLRWRHRISDRQAQVCSWVDLKDGWVSFFDTKNRFKHTLPLAPCARRILVLREGSTGEWVFPARSSRAKQGHYLDSKAILSGLRQDAQIGELRTHDLRRTFSTIVEEMASYAVLKRMLNHRALSDVTGRYPKVDSERLLEEMARVERAIVGAAPVVAAALMPAPFGPA